MRQDSHSLLDYTRIVFALSCLLVAACGPSTDDDQSQSKQKGAIIGQVQSLENESAVSDATVTVDGETYQTSEDGWFSIPELPTDDRTTLTVEADGYVKTQRIISVGSGRTFADIRLFERAPFQQVDASAGGTVDFENGAALQLPDGALVDSSGQPYEGMAQVSVTNLDPSLDNASLATPGDFTALPGEADETTRLETYGMTRMVIENSSGDRLQIADDAEATLSIPVPQSLTDAEVPSEMPLWRYDESQGRWVEASGGVSYNSESNCYDAQVSGTDGAGFWNADIPYESTCVSGKIVRPDTDSGSSGIVVRAEGISYIGSSSTTTDADGNFQLEVKRSTDQNQASVAIQAQGGGLYLDEPIRVDPTPTEPAASGNCKDLGTTELDYPHARVSLTWGEKPEDLDSHLTGPVADSDTTTSDDDRFHLYYARQTIGDQALLDTDDTSSFGPEVTSILRTVPGIYVYSVKNFSGESSHPITESEANIQAYLPNRVARFRVGNADDQTTENAVNPVWRVFRFEITEGGDFTNFQPLNTIVDEDAEGRVFHPDYTPMVNGQ